MRLALIAAVARNGVIGRAGEMPWRLSADLRRFRALTMGKPIVMGRRTWQSIGRPLPGRTSIVISRDAAFPPDGARVFPDFDAALAAAEKVARADGAAEVMVIGGAQIYALALPRADRIYLTEIHADIDGDTIFPTIDGEDWAERSREFHAAGPEDSFDYSFVVLDRRR